MYKRCVKQKHPIISIGKKLVGTTLLFQKGLRCCSVIKALGRLNNTQHSGILPPGVIYASDNIYANALLVAQEGARIRRIGWKDGKKDSHCSVRTLELAFPNVVFLATKNGAECKFRCFFTPRPVTSVRDMLYLPTLPNSRNGFCCYPPTYAFRSKDLIHHFSKFRVDFWNSIFTYDIPDLGDYGRYKDGWNIYDWEEETRKTGQFNHKMIPYDRLKDFTMNPKHKYHLGELVSLIHNKNL